MNLRINISKKWQTFTFAADFHLSVDKAGVFGHSGSGKSTLLHLLAGLLKPDKGVIQLNGDTLFDSSKGINLPPEQRRIGMVFQQGLLFPHLTVKDNLLYGWKRTPTDLRQIRPEAIIQALHLGPLLQRRIGKLSGGEKQRVALGRTMLANPCLILLDEPLSGLDDELKFEIIPYLHKVSADFNLPLLFTSHSRTEMKLMTEEVLIFREGALSKHVASTEIKGP